MAGSVYRYTKRSGKTAWRAFYYVPEPGGAMVQRSKSFERERDAKAFVHAKAEEAASGVGDPAERTVAAFLEDWIKHLEARSQLSPATLAFYRRQSSILASMIGAKRLGRVIPDDLTRAYDTLLAVGCLPTAKRRNGTPKKGKPWSVDTVRAFHGTIRTAFESARKARLIRVNPADDAEVPTPDPDKLDGAEGVRAFTDDEIERMFAVASDNLYPGLDAVIMVLMVTGVRRSELLGLSWPHVHFDDCRIDIRQTVIAGQKGEPILRPRMKTKKARRSIDVPVELMDRLRRHRADQAEHAMRWGREYRRDLQLVFPDWNGEPLGPNRMTYALRLLMRAAGVEAASPVHGWRHSMPLRLLDDGHDIVTVSRRMGHTKPAMTLNRYGHSTREKDREAGETMGRKLARLKLPKT